MNPKSLSASAVQAYESCPARFAASYIARANDLSGDPASIGTVCHEVMRRWVEEEYYLRDTDWRNMERLFVQEYEKVFSHHGRWDDGIEMLKKWHARNEGLHAVEILSTETKDWFGLFLGPKDNPTYTIPVNFIWDRCDRLPTPSGGYEIRVVDYKTVAQPFPPEQLKKKVQARIYSLAARLKYPDAERIWVTFDLLRYDEVGIVFTRDEDIETWQYLQNVYERILADDGETEKLNPECRFCVRKQACDTLTRHVSVGGPLGITDPNVAARKRMELDAAKSALTVAIDELDQVILQHCQQEEIFEFRTDDCEVAITAKRTRDIDSQTVVNIVGEHIAAEYGKIGVTAVDRILKDSRLTSDQRSQLRQAFLTKFGEPYVKVKPIAVLGDDGDGE